MGASVTFTVQTPTKADQTISFEIPPLPEGASAKGVTARLWLSSKESGTVIDDSTEGWRVDAQVLTRNVTPIGEFNPANYAHVRVEDFTDARTLTTWAIWPDGVREEWTDEQAREAKAAVGIARAAAANTEGPTGHPYDGLRFEPMSAADQHAWAARGIHEALAFEQRSFEERDFELLVGLDGVEGSSSVLVPVSVNGVHSSTLLLSASSSGKCYGTLQ